MELRQLEHFIAVAEERHFTNAAARCHIAQSALSRSIRMLERELGSQLLVRTSRAVELTECGRHFLAAARHTLDSAAAARAVVDDVRGLRRGTVSVGSVPTFRLVHLPGILAEFCRAHPEIEIKLLGGGGSTRLIEAVRTGRLDLALVTMPPRLPKQLEATVLATQPYAFVCGTDHPLAAEESVALKSVASETFVDFPMGAALRSANDAAFAADGLERRVALEADQPAVILDIVAEGLGVTILPWYLAADCHRVRLVPLSHMPIAPWTLAAVTSTPRPLSAGARALLDLVVARSPSAT